MVVGNTDGTWIHGWGYKTSQGMDGQTQAPHPESFVGGTAPFPSLMAQTASL